MIWWGYVSGVTGRCIWGGRSDGEEVEAQTATLPGGADAADAPGRIYAMVFGEGFWGERERAAFDIEWVDVQGHQVKSVTNNEKEGRTGELWLRRI